MIRIAGTLLITLGSLCIGIQAYLAHAAHIRDLRAYASMLEMLRCEIAIRMAPIEQALKSARLPDGSCRFVDAVLCGISRLGGADIGIAWCDALSLAPQDIRTELSSLGNILGRYSAEEQARALDDAIRRVEALRSAAENKLACSGRLYITFGICGGVAMAVLLL